MVKNNQNLTVCAKCGYIVKVIQCIVAPSDSRYAGGHICVRCIDALAFQGNMIVMRPTEFKFPAGGSGASV